jgi:hypothetical protein
VQSVPRFYKQDKSRVYLVARYSAAGKDVTREAEGSMALDVVTRQPMKIQQTQKI